MIRLAVWLVLSILALPVLGQDGAAARAHEQVSTWVLLKLTGAGCTVRTDPGAMQGLQLKVRESLTDEQYQSITNQTLYLATACNTRQAVAEAALLELSQDTEIQLQPLRLEPQTAVYSVRGSEEGVASLMALTPLGEESGIAVITMAAGSGP